jgi:GNAT superfamily N-acetyltransferase
MRHNMPEQIPAVILARLAVDKDWQGQGLGSALFQDAVERTLLVSQSIAARLLIVHAISPNAEAFYQQHGLIKLPCEHPTYALDLLKFQQLLV